MRHYLPYLMLGLPALALVTVWQWLPARLVIHSAGADKWVSRDDFGGIVISVTAVVAVLAYGLLQLQAAFRPFSQPEPDKAYVKIAGGAALIGLLLVGIGLASP